MTHERHRFRFTGSVIATFPLALVFLAVPRPGEGQQWAVTMPRITVAPAGKSTRPITATEAAVQTSTTRENAYSRAAMMRHRRDVPVDSIRTAIATAGRQWLAIAQQRPIRGIQLDASGRVGVAAGQDAYARTQIAARLAMPGLSLGDRAFALRSAVEAFTDVHATERLPVAETYLAQLEALGDSAAAWQFEAHRTLLYTYYLLGRSADVVRHGTHVVQHLSVMSFAHRVMFYFSDDDIYGPTVEALTAQPEARTKIDALDRLVRAAAMPSPQLVASDSLYSYLGRNYLAIVDGWIAGRAKLGLPAAPLQAHSWFNRSTPSAHGVVQQTSTLATPLANVVHSVTGEVLTMPVADGKVRIVEVANTGCAPCVLELYALERLKQQYPEIEPVMLTWTSGSVANRLVDADEEIRALRKFFVEEAKLTFPIGIWTGKKVRNEDGGLAPEVPAYFHHDYPLFGKPMSWIIDGQGIVRRIFTGYDRDIEQQIRRTIEFLLREAAPSRVAGRDSRRDSLQSSPAPHP
jgi:hypothetical protein